MSTIRTHRDSVETLASDEDYGAKLDPQKQLKHDVAGIEYEIRPSHTHIAASNDNRDSMDVGVDSPWHKKSSDDDWDKRKNTDDYFSYDREVNTPKLQPKNIGLHTKSKHSGKKAFGAFALTFTASAAAGFGAGTLIGGVVSLPIGGLGAIPGAAVGAAAGAVVGVFAGAGAALLAQRSDKNAGKQIRETRDRLQNQGQKFSAVEALRLSTTPFDTWKKLLNVDTSKVPDKDIRDFIRNEVMKSVAKDGVATAADLKADLENMFVSKKDMPSNWGTKGVKDTRRNMNQAILKMLKDQGPDAANQFKAELLQLRSIDKEALEGFDAQEIYDDRIAQENSFPYARHFENYPTPRDLLKDTLTNPDADRIMTEFSNDRVHGQDFDKEYRCYKATQEMLALDPENSLSDRQRFNELFGKFQREFANDEMSQANVQNVYQTTLSQLYKQRTGRGGMVPFHTACKYAAESDDYVKEKLYILRQAHNKMHQMITSYQNNVSYPQWKKHKLESNDNIFADLDPQKLPEHDQNPPSSNINDDDADTQIIPLQEEQNNSGDVSNFINNMRIKTFLNQVKDEAHQNPIFSRFHKAAGQHFKDENTAFLMEVARLKSMPMHNDEDKANFQADLKGLYEKFIGASAEKQINLSSELFATLPNHIYGMVTNDPSLEEVRAFQESGLNAVQDEIVNLMGNDVSAIRKTFQADLRKNPPDINQLPSQKQVTEVRGTGAIEEEQEPQLSELDRKIKEAADTYVTDGGQPTAFVGDQKLGLAIHAVMPSGFEGKLIAPMRPKVAAHGTLRENVEERLRHLFQQSPNADKNAIQEAVAEGFEMAVGDYCMANGIETK